MFDARLLSVFREVATRGSFSEAATALSFTQPAVSQQIARLERELGTRLLARNRWLTVLTRHSAAAYRGADVDPREVGAARCAVRRGRDLPIGLDEGAGHPLRLPG